MEAAAVMDPYHNLHHRQITECKTPVWEWVAEEVEEDVVDLWGKQIFVKKQFFFINLVKTLKFKVGKRNQNLLHTLIYNIGYKHNNSKGWLT